MIGINSKNKKDVLNSKILNKIKKNTNLSEGHIRNEISKIKARYPKTSQNGCAQIWCYTKQNFSIRNLLSKEDRESLPQITTPTSETSQIVRKMYPKIIIKNEKEKKIKDWNVNDYIQNVGTIVVIFGLFLASLNNVFKEVPYLSRILDIIFVIATFIILIIFIGKIHKSKMNKKGYIDWRIIGWLAIILFVIWILCKLNIFCLFK